MSRIVKENGKYYRIPISEDIIRWGIPISVMVGSGALVYKNIGYEDDMATKICISSMVSLGLGITAAIATNHGIRKVIGKRKNITKKRSARRK